MGYIVPRGYPNDRRLGAFGLGAKVSRPATPTARTVILGKEVSTGKQGGVALTERGQDRFVTSYASVFGKPSSGKAVFTTPIKGGQRVGIIEGKSTKGSVVTLTREIKPAGEPFKEIFRTDTIDVLVKKTGDKTFTGVGTSSDSASLFKGFDLPKQVATRGATLGGKGKSADQFVSFLQKNKPTTQKPSINQAEPFRLQPLKGSAPSLKADVSPAVAANIQDVIKFRTSPRVRPLSSTITLQPPKQQPTTRQSLRAIPVIKQLPRSKQTSIISGGISQLQQPEPDVGLGIGLKLIPVVKPITGYPPPPILRLEIPTETITKTPPPPIPPIILPPTPPRRPPPVGFPPLGGPPLGGSFKRRRIPLIKRSQPRQFQPSVFARAFNITARRQPRVLTGFGIRPIILGQPRKKRKRKKK